MRPNTTPMSGYTQEERLMKALVMGQLLGHHFGLHGKADAHELGRASVIADNILAASVAPAVAPEHVTKPVVVQGPSPADLQREFGKNFRLPGMPPPAGNPSHIVPQPPGLGSPNDEPPPMVIPNPQASPDDAGANVLDLSQPR